MHKGNASFGRVSFMCKDLETAVFALDAWGAWLYNKTITEMCRQGGILRFLRPREGGLGWKPPM